MIRNRIAWVVWLVLTAGLYFFENNTGTRALLAASLLVPVFSVFCAFFAAAKTEVKITGPDRDQAGDPLVLKAEVKGPFLLTFARVHLSLLLSNTLTRSEAPMEVILSGASAAKKDFICDASFCGVVTAGMSAAVAEDWFGLSSFSIKQREEASVTIYPKTYPVQLLCSDASALAMEGERWSMNRPGFDPSETYGIREYIPGDPIRQIHWKLSEKTGKTMIRELGLPVSDDILLLWESFCSDDPSPKACHQAMEAMISAARTLLSEGYSFKAAFVSRALKEPELFEISDERDLGLLEAALLEAGTMYSDDSTAALFKSRYPGSTFAHTVIFSPTPKTGAVNLFEGNRVTLVLPSETDGALAPAELALAHLSPENPYLEI